MPFLNEVLLAPIYPFNPLFQGVEPFLKYPPVPVVSLFLYIIPFTCSSEKLYSNLSFIFSVISLYVLPFTIEAKYSFSSSVHLCCGFLSLLPFGLPITIPLTSSEPLINIQ